MLTKAERQKRARKGGKTRSKSLTPERRKEIAQKAAITRWAKQPAAQTATQ